MGVVRGGVTFESLPLARFGVHGAHALCPFISFLRGALGAASIWQANCPPHERPAWACAAIGAMPHRTKPAVTVRVPRATYGGNPPDPRHELWSWRVERLLARACPACVYM